MRPKFEDAALDVTFTKHLVAIDGIQPEIAENVRELGFEADFNDQDEEFKLDTAASRAGIKDSRVSAGQQARDIKSSAVQQEIIKVQPSATLGESTQ